ncbi:MAG: DHCW motif cupin fold protein [Ferruginibacter sp.]|nr:DHCW motif cupin fold protein [Ferruginibacter sp.]
MKIKQFPFQTVNWEDIEAEEHQGTSGKASWKIFNMGNIRVRMVEYTAGYIANHWCNKGHIIYCIKGEMTTKLQDGREFILRQGMTYHVGDNSDAHCSTSKNGCVLFIVD